MIIIGASIYYSKYRNKEKPKFGIKREKIYDYLKDYLDLKLYYMSIGFMFMGTSVLIAILIMSLVMD
jgi:hypothetical protein